MRCGVCGSRYSNRTLNKHYTQCEDDGLAPTPTINDIKKNMDVLIEKEVRAHHCVCVCACVRVCVCLCACVVYLCA